MICDTWRVLQLVIVGIFVGRLRQNDFTWPGWSAKNSTMKGQASSQGSSPKRHHSHGPMSLLDRWHPICPKFQNTVEPMVDNSSRSLDAIFGWAICVITLNNEVTDLQNFWLRWTSCRFRLLVLQYPENRRRLTSPFAGKRGIFVWVAQ